MATTSVRSFSSIVPSSTCDALSGPVYSLNARIIFIPPLSLSFITNCGLSIWLVPYPSDAESLVMALCRAHLSSEHAIADRGVEQHEREDEQAFSPEHERKTRLRRCCFLDREDERDRQHRHARAVAVEQPLMRCRLPGPQTAKQRQQRISGKEDARSTTAPRR